MRVKWQSQRWRRASCARAVPPVARPLHTARGVRWTVISIFLAGCATAVSEPNPPGPPGASPQADRAFSGRITLGSSALRDEVERFDSTWMRRLEVLGLTTRVTYDDNRAVFDIYGADPATLRDVARALLDPGAWSLSRTWADGHLAWWSPVSGRAYVYEDRRVLCDLRSASELVISRAGAAYRLPIQIRWTLAGTDGNVVDTGPPGGECPTATVWPTGMVLQLATDRTDATNQLLAVAGGSLPAPAFLVGIEPAGGAR